MSGRFSACCASVVMGARVSAIVEPDELRAGAIARDFAGHPHPPEVIANIGDLSSLSAASKPDAAIIAVPTAITGFYGQNVAYPGINTVAGFITSSSVIVLLVVALYVMFRRRDWL